MADNDPFAAFGGKQITEQPTETAPAAASSSSDLFAAFGGKSVSSSDPQAQSVASTPTPSGDPFASFGGRSISTTTPVNGQPEAPQEHLYQDKSQPWYKRAWDWANTPLTESVGGLADSREGAGGFERAGEKILSGFTSPLSIALTAATFGTGGILESAGANLLKQTGQFTAEQLPTIVKASEAALEATKALKPIEPVITSALKDAGGETLVNLVNEAKKALGPIDLSSRFGEEGIQSVLAKTGKFTEDQLGELAKASKTIDEAKQGFTPVEDAVRSAVGDEGVNTWKQAQQALYDNGLTEHDLLGGNALERGAYHIIRNTIPKESPAVAARMAKTANALLAGGFTYQQFETAAAMSPRFLDALKEGDWESAKEYGTEAAAGAALGLLGTPHALNAAGELFKPLLETDKFRPNDQFLALERAAKERDAQHELATAYARDIDTKARKLLGHDQSADKPQKGLDLATVFHHVVTGGDTDKAAAWYNVLSEAAGRDDRLPVSTSPHVPRDTTVVDQAGNPLTVYHGTTQAFDQFNPKSTSGERADFENPGEALYFTASPDKASLHATGAKQVPIGKGFWEYARPGANVRPAFLDIKNPYRITGGAAEGLKEISTLTPQKIAELKSQGYDGVIYGNNAEIAVFDPKQVIPKFSSPNNGLPDDIADKIKNNNFSKTSPAYQQTVLDSLKRVATGDLTEKEVAASKNLREEDANNYQIGSVNDILHNYLENHMTRLYKDTNPDGNIVLSNSKQGKFQTNVSMARHQVYDSHLTALLKSPKEIVMDPVYSTAQGRAALVKAAANRQFIDTLRDNFTRGSDGRPAVVVSGAGKVIQGPNGEDPRTMVSPDRVRKINIADPVLEQLQKNGDLQRFLDDGTIKEITPTVRNENIDDFINRLEQRGQKQEAQYDEEGNNILRQKIAELNRIKTLQGPEKSQALDAYNATQKKMYAWDPQDYVSLEHPSMKAWKFATSDPSGNPVFVNSDIMVHPEFAEYVKNRLGLEQSALQRNPVSKALLGAGTKLKETLLSLSPFHMVQLGLRGVLTGVNPFTLEAPDLINGAKVDPSDPYSPTKLYKMVEQGMQTGTDYKALQEHSEGVSSGGGLLKLLPVVGKPLSNALNFYQDFLFKRYLPAIKASAAEHMFDEYQRLHPEWSVDRVAKVAGTHASEAFGGINWKAMGRNATTQDWGRLLLLAPDWLESELRSGARLFNGEEGGLGRAQVAKMSMALWGIARVLNYTTTGNPHYEAPFGLAIKNKDGKETIYGIRTLPTDLLHAASDPVGFIKGRLAPTIRLGQEALTQRDQFGRKLAPEDLWIDAFRNMAPIPAQAIGQAITGTGPEIGNVGQLWKAGGGTAQTYQTPAQKLAAELASNHNEDGILDSSIMHRHRVVLGLEDKLRSGEVTWPELYQLAYTQDQITPKELETIKKNYKATRELDASTASLYTRASRLPAKEYFSLLDVASPAERTALIPLTKQVIKRYINSAKKDLTPQERASDPLFNRVLRMLPQIETAEPAQQ